MSIESVMSFNHLISCRHLFLLPLTVPSIRVFPPIESALHIRWPKYWSFNFSISPSNEYLRLTSFRIDWFDLLAVQGTVKSLLQHHSLKASILWHSAFFMVQHSHLYITTGKIVALTIQTFVSKVMSLLFNMLCRFVIAFLPRKASFNFMVAVAVHSNFGAQKVKSVITSNFFPSLCHEVMGLDAWIFVFWMLTFKPAFSFSSYTLTKRLFSSSSLSGIREISSAYLRPLIFLLTILISASDSSSPAFHPMYSV